jgi:hypothetical protein
MCFSVSGTLSAIKAKFRLLQVGREMLGADARPCANDATFEKRKRRFDCVGVYIAPNVNLVFMAARAFGAPARRKRDDAERAALKGRRFSVVGCDCRGGSL